MICGPQKVCVAPNDEGVTGVDGGDIEADTTVDVNVEATESDVEATDDQEASIEIGEEDFFDSTYYDLVPDDEWNDVSSDADGDLPADEMTALGTGQPCSVDGECSSGRCLDPADPVESLGHKICAGPCSEAGMCPFGMACMPTEKAAGGSSYVFECVPFPRGLCTSCGTKEDCPTINAHCLYMTGGTFCGAPCPDLVCPTGFHCVTIETPGIPSEAKRQCVPQFGTCACIEQTKLETFDCTLANDAGTCTGTIACNPAAGWGRCNSFLPEAELCDGLDNDCDGDFDETFTIADWDGKKRFVGDPCGTGECAGGHVECTSGKNTAICSTDAKKLPLELCGDNKDNNCDGQIDEGCYSEDIDGDGDPNETDCAPWDAAKHHIAAVEPCCPAATPADEILELCDFNCDGVVTACGPHDADGDGHAAQTFGGDDCNDSDPTIYPGAPERCDDGIDQDCDGSDLHCCNADAPPTCVGPDDGDADGWPKGADCNDSNSQIHPYAAESCNYKDDDCDGVIDEGNPGGKNADGVYVEGGSPCGLDVGECKPGQWVCMHYTTGVKMECVGATGKSDEICDGKDNDCDGLFDEAFPDNGKPCDGNDLDQCKNGTWTCKAGGSGLECVNEAVHDIMEVCDGKSDKDCDGVIGNGCFPEDVDGDGYATIGTFADCDDRRSEFHPNAKEPCCDPILSGSAAIAACDRNCDGHVTYCDANDKDMDGHVAKGFKDASGKDGDDCNDKDPMIYPGAPEKCGDGIMQDCSQSSDVSCVQVVDGDGDGYSPPADCNDDNPKVHPGATELCDNQDDDCDGAADDGNPGGGQECGSNVGECKAGVTVCVHYQYSAKVVCVPNQAPSPEICDGKDNNCNGQTDEYFPLLGQPCDGPDSDQCQYGKYECAENGIGVVCGPELVENIVETCDAKDNNCDGQTDEGFLYQGAAIGGACEGIGTCGLGTVECAPDRKHATCSTNADGSASEAHTEICNVIDDDCDGMSDEDLTLGGIPLGADCVALGECGPGVVVCSPTDLIPTCSTAPNGTDPQSSPEICDGADNDCDGTIDEDCPPGCVPTDTIGCGGAVDSTTEGGTNEMESYAYPDCFWMSATAGPEKVVAFETQAAVRVQATVTTGGESPYVFVLGQSCEASSCIAEGIGFLSKSATATFLPSPGKAYYLTMDGSATPYAFHLAAKCLEADCADGVDNDGNGMTDCADSECGGTPLVCNGGMKSVTVAKYSHVAGYGAACTMESGTWDDSVLSLTVDAPKTVTITVAADPTTSGDDFDVFLLSGGCTGDSCVKASIGSLSPQVLTFTAQPGVYYVVVERVSAGADSNNKFTITATCP
jgi:hypothetical protein